MSEKPILFSGQMIRALLDGTKTQTRRVVKPQPELIYSLTDDRLSVIHNAHDNKKWCEVETYSSVSELGLHGGRRWQDLFEDAVCRIREEGIRGVVCISRSPRREAVFEYFTLPPEQKSHEVCSQVGVYGVSRDAKSHISASAPHGRQSPEQRAKQFEMGDTKRAVDGCAGSWNIAQRGKTLGGEIHGRRTRTLALGNTERSLQPTKRCSGFGGIARLNLVNSPWEVACNLWVKETFWVDDGGECGPAAFYAATDERSDIKLKPSIFMPRKFSRLTLEITDVRVERLQDIPHEDAIAEGCSGQGWKTSDTRSPIVYPVEQYEQLWESINGKGSWVANPWVWAITFKRITTTN